MGFQIKNLKIQINTAKGEYGFECEFKSGLNIVRGNNSSGKSTLINSLIYSLGMEEIIGGKGPKVLPYALKEYVEDDSKNKIKISSSYVYLEIASQKEIVTLKRSINSQEKNSKLIEVIHGAYLTNPMKAYEVTPKFLHDKGSAQNKDAGFFSFLEHFLRLDLPMVPGANGGEVKLYLQTVLSALLIEQKRGWTDYIANTPYYAIRDVRTKIVEFLLGFDVFENDRKKARILSELANVQSRWSEERLKVKLIEEVHSINILGIKSTADDVFDSNLVRLSKKVGESEVDFYDHISEMVRKVEDIEQLEHKYKKDASEDLVNEYRESKQELDQMLSMLETVNADCRLAKSRLSEYVSTKMQIENDLEKNKVAKKLKMFGAEQNLNIAKDSCPTCHQNIDDSLFLADTLFQPMSIDDNVKYLESQKKMVARYISGLEKTIDKLESQSRELSASVAEKRNICVSLKKDLRASGHSLETDLRVKIQLENKIEKLVQAERSIEKSFSEFSEISKRFKNLKAELASLPERKQSASDLVKHSLFQDSFRKYAKLFGYKSAATSDIEINRDTLFPYLSGLELREVNTDIKSDSSASDFVRLIWSYLLSIFSTSSGLGGNHVGILVFDEPGQHSMGVTSVNALLKTLSSQQGLQGIVAASFDESDEVFEESVEGVNYHLISCGNRLLRPES